MMWDHCLPWLFEITDSFEGSFSRHVCGEQLECLSHQMSFGNVGTLECFLVKGLVWSRVFNLS